MATAWVKTRQGMWLLLRDGERVGEVYPRRPVRWMAGNWWARRGVAQGQAVSVEEAKRMVEEALARQLTLWS